MPLSAAPENILSDANVSTEKAAQIITLLIEGMSVRVASRITGVHQGTIQIRASPPKVGGVDRGEKRGYNPH